MRVLIVLPGAIGDVVRGLPLLGRLRESRPEAVIGWSVEPLSAPLLAGHPWLDRVHVFQRKRGVRGLIAHARELRDARYDVVLDLGRSAKSALICIGSRSPRRIGFAPTDGREGGWLLATERLPTQPPARSKLEQFLAFGDALGLESTTLGFGLVSAPGERERIDAMLAGVEEPLLGVPVGSSCPSRRWLPDRTAEAMGALQRAHGLRAVLVGTAADRAFAAEVARRSPGAIDLTGRTGLRDLVALFERCRVVIGPDSGALHIAAAVGRPVVSLWGATSATRSAPFGSEAWAIAGEAPCAPCFLKHCPIGRLCMQRIDVATVVAAAQGALAA